MERRVWLFGLAYAEGTLLAFLIGQRLISVLPAAFFIPAIVLGLLVGKLFCFSLYIENSAFLRL